MLDEIKTLIKALQDEFADSLDKSKHDPYFLGQVDTLEHVINILEKVVKQDERN